MTRIKNFSRLIIGLTFGRLDIDFLGQIRLR